MHIRSNKTIITLMNTLLLVLAHSFLIFGQDSNQIIGPLVGHTDTNSTNIWARLKTEGSFTLEVKKVDEKPWKKIKGFAKKENDFCITWKVNNLMPATPYQYRIKKGNDILSDVNLRFKTAPLITSKTQVHIAFGSGSSYEKETGEVWDQIGQSNVDAMVLLGDTPYIDTTDLTIQRDKYREFSSFDAFEKLAQSTSIWGIWDDHDFAANNADGRAKGKHNSLKVFKEYRPNASFGDGKEGIYTKFNYGAVEVFLLDSRWWAWTTSSYADPEKMTLLGKTQWEWLKKSLLESKATFKLITIGMIWGNKRNKDKDDWSTYTHERDALFNFIGKEKISGVVLIGGDIHVSRVLKHKTEKEAGYPLYEFITSPLHSRTNSSFNYPHPDLIRDAVIPHTFLKVTADPTVVPATLRAEYFDKDGNKLFDDVSITIDQLSYK